MYELYNENEKNTSTNLNIYNNLFNKFSKIGTLMSVPFLTFLPVFIYALMQAESIIIMDLATYVGPLCNINKLFYMMYKIRYICIQKNIVFTMILSYALFLLIYNFFRIYLK